MRICAEKKNKDMEILHTKKKLCVPYFRGIFLTGLKNNQPLIIQKIITYFKN